MVQNGWTRGASLGIGRLVRNRLFLAIRLSLAFSIIGNVVVALRMAFGDADASGVEIARELAERMDFIIWGVVTFILTFGSEYIERRERIDLPDILEVVIVLFIFAGLFLSVRYKLYYRFFWWDDLLHTISGVIIGFIGFIVIYRINYRYSMDISPLLVAIFSFTFAVTLGVVWEILEFACDVALGSAHQKWNLPPDAVLMGRPYQGSGLRDTMSDLIVDSVGALITSFITYWMYKHRKRKTLADMRRIMPELVGPGMDPEFPRRSRPCAAALAASRVARRVARSSPLVLELKEVWCKIYS